MCAFLRGSGAVSKRVYHHAPGSLFSFMDNMWGRVHIDWYGAWVLWMIALAITYGQNGVMGILLLKAPDITRLDGAGVFSNVDLYCTGGTAMVREYVTQAADEYGEVSVLSLYRLKKIIARAKGVQITLSSSLETCSLLFLGHGDYKTEKVPLDTLLDALDTHKETETDSVVRVWDITIPFGGSIWMTYTTVYMWYIQDTLLEG